MADVANSVSGETWNLMKIGYQLKQVRERLAKGLVDKGILRTEKRNFLLFDMATHPVADSGAKDDIHKRVRNVCSNRTVILPPTPWLPEDVEFRYLRTITMVCAAYAANVLENALVTMSHEARERAFAQVDELLAEYSQWPFGRRTGGSQGIGANLAQAVNDEINKAKDRELQLEVCDFSVRCHKALTLNPAISGSNSNVSRLLLHVWAFSPGSTLFFDQGCFMSRLSIVPPSSAPIGLHLIEYSSGSLVFTLV